MIAIGALVRIRRVLLLLNGVAAAAAAGRQAAAPPLLPLRTVLAHWQRCSCWPRASTFDMLLRLIRN